ncbi:hypothetical protein GCK72_023269 [Caenorhabditis remanei]|uniref:Uncharacterized protein n=1 Tax=Caenorhabditis remanei TaxID=31234 RepID=A0A6A5FWH7_CAERE|nr:hypothetical protein GCK72_023269 [Caenorhabditis remanei]KAF1746811.1 hypothetical protein GCK72_023269 [Caenorhabditis remanei]
MLFLRHFSICFLFYSVRAELGVPELRVVPNGADIMSVPRGPHVPIGQYTVGRTYTFEVFLDETTQHDYVINSCFMNNDQIIGPNGCVDCGTCISKSVETESYNKPGAIKRTLVEFVARSSTIQFTCHITRYLCSGCAERSCQRYNMIPWSHFQVIGQKEEAYMYPPSGYPIGPMGAFPIPIPPNIYPTPPMGGFHMPPQAPPQMPPPVGPPGPPAAYGGGAGVWPWWVWLLIILLLLLLLCCLLALCFAAFMKRRKEKKTTEVVVVDGKDCAVGTDHVTMTCVGTDTQDIVKVQPAVVLGADSLEQHHHHQLHQQNQYSRNQAEYDQGSVMAGGSYSLREGVVHEGYTRTLPREVYAANDRYASRDRSFERHSQDKYTDRSSYRNFAYERDMGKVEPMDGFDEVETRERTYCLSDDDQELVEKNIKRTHTTRYVTETREYEPEHDNEERMRGDEYHHASYTHSLPV